MKAPGRGRRNGSTAPDRRSQSRAAQLTWNPPEPPGYPASVQSLGGFAAPLLAAASFTMTALLLPTLSNGSRNFARWPDAALTLFVASGLAQIAAVQAAMWARRYDTVPDELAQWYPDEVRDGRPSEWLHALQSNCLELSQRWTDWTRLAYHVGILLLLGGLTTVVIPAGPMSGSRWLLVMTAGSGLVGELSWIVGASFLDPQLRGKAFCRVGLLLVSLAVLTLTVVAKSSAARISVLFPAALLVVAQFMSVSPAAAPTWSEPMAAEHGRVNRLRGPARVLLAVVLVAVSVTFAFEEAPGGGWRVGLAAAAVLALVIEADELRRITQAERAPSGPPDGVSPA
jgi:hypothetical protein